MLVSKIILVIHSSLHFLYVHDIMLASLTGNAKLNILTVYFTEYISPLTAWYLLKNQN